MAEQIHHAVKVIKGGGIVAFPTETSYGLAVDPFNIVALQKLYELKQRDMGKPFLLLVCNQDQLQQCTSSIPQQYAPLIDKYWPGPLTIIFPANEKLPEILKRDNGVAVRYTSNQIAQNFLQQCGIPLTATSANLSGDAPLVSAKQCLELLSSSGTYVIESPTNCNDNCSTIITLVDNKIKVLRQGLLDVETDIHGINKGYNYEMGQKSCS